MTPGQLATATGARLDRATEWLPSIESAMAEFEINTPARQAMFCAQTGYESGSLQWSVELWGPTRAQRGYEGRLDLGNTEPGDGAKFRGRGLLQTTGRANYAATGKALGVDLLLRPELLGLPPLAARSAGWFWQRKGLNELADAGDFTECTRRINGGLNGLAQRQELYINALGALA